MGNPHDAAKPLTPRRRLGNAGEDAACRYLCAKGWRVLTRNWRKGSLELDVICRDGDTLVFVEVRTRTAGGKLTAAESLTPTKQRSFLRAVRAYLAETDQWSLPCRCDLVCVTAQTSGACSAPFPQGACPAPSSSGASSTPCSFTVEYCPHVLDCSALDRSVGSGHTSWQPW